MIRAVAGGALIGGVSGDNVDREESDIDRLNVGLAEQGRQVIAIGGRCEWGKCRHCALAGSSDVLPLDSEGVLRQLDHVGPRVETLCLYTPGSWWKSELNDLRPQILGKIRGMVQAKTVVVEARSDLITADRIRELEKALPGKGIEVGVGLDHVNSYFRNDILNRGDSRRSYLSAMAVGRESTTKLVTYVALGCPTLTEQEAVGMAVETAIYAYDAGTDVVSLEPLQIQEGTVQGFFAQRGAWQAPWKWSMVQVIRNFRGLVSDTGVEVRVGGEVQVPIPVGRPSNRCSVCDSDGRFAVAFREFNRTQDLDLLRVLSCECLGNWERVYNDQTQPPEEIADLLAEFDRTRQCA